MTFAAMLLVSVSAFAQSGNNEPLKGDVNGDGVVDVADIAALIAIIKNNAAPQTTYYWYVGTTQPNAVNNPSTWRTTSNDAGFTINPNISSSDKIWVAYPDSWTLEITDADGYGVGNDYLSASIKNSINGYLINRFTADSNTSAWTFKFTK